MWVETGIGTLLTAKTCPSQFYMMERNTRSNLSFLLGVPYGGPLLADLVIKFNKYMADLLYCPCSFTWPLRMPLFTHFRQDRLCFLSFTVKLAMFKQVNGHVQALPNPCNYGLVQGSLKLALMENCKPWLSTSSLGLPPLHLTRADFIILQ